jgi:glycerophosphoryl diester phosphodiesterase
MKIIEQSIIPKSPAKKSEDGLVITNDFIAVIDGSTSKTLRKYIPWISNGRYAMLLISRYVRRMQVDTSCHQFCVGVTKMIRKHYRFRFPVSRMVSHPEERLCASVILFSRLRREVWLVGDCQCLIGGEFFDNPKPYEAQLAELRGQRVRELLAQGVAEHSLLEAHDPAREVMIPTMLQVMQNQNKTYAVVDGFPIPEDKVPVITIGFQPVEIVFASDGYPFLCSTLAESEQKLDEQRRNDPLNIHTFKATKAFVEGNNSFDDRTYVRFTV